METDKDTESTLSELSISLDQLDENENLTNLSKSEKLDYQARKVDAKLKKYEAILSAAEKIERVKESEVTYQHSIYTYFISF